MMICIQRIYESTCSHRHIKKDKTGEIVKLESTAETIASPIPIGPPRFTNTAIATKTEQRFLK